MVIGGTREGHRLVRQRMGIAHSGLAAKTVVLAQEEVWRGTALDL
jgi:hypothetical protein